MFNITAKYIMANNSLMYINVYPINIRSSVRLFADDFVLYRTDSTRWPK